MAREPVYLNVYCKKWMHEYFWSLGIGVYHSGVEVYGAEYCFGWHSRDVSGIYQIEPKNEEELGDDYKFKASILLDHTDFSRSDVGTIIAQMGEEYQGNKYHLMNKNCNHFADSFCKVLCGKEIPNWVNRLAYITSFIPFIDKAVSRSKLFTPLPPEPYDTYQTPASAVEVAQSARESYASSQRSSGNSSSTLNSPRHMFNNVLDFLNAKR